MAMKLLNHLRTFPVCGLSWDIIRRSVQSWLDANPSRIPGAERGQESAEITVKKRVTEKTINYFAGELNANYVIKITMKAQNSNFKYVLFKETNRGADSETVKYATRAINKS